MRAHGGDDAPEGLDFEFSQVFGERAAGEEVQDADIISAVEFNVTGEKLATGDRGGRVVLFERIHHSKSVIEELRSRFYESGVGGADGSDVRPPAMFSGRKEPVEYRYLTEFQSHEPEFDYLKSLEIEEKINTLRWCNQGANDANFVLSTNDKTIKLWKVYEKHLECVSGFNVGRGDGGGFRRMNGGGASSAPDVTAVAQHNGALKFPSIVRGESVFTARNRRVYANAHAYHINSLSVNSDGETFISADDLRINLWHLESSQQSFNIVDIKPTNMEDLSEVITAAEFHPTHCNYLAYSSSKGTIRLTDLRQHAVCDSYAKLFELPEPAEKRSFFSEIIASISDIKFSRDGRYILSRDYLTMKLWDINMDRAPVATVNVHDHLRPKLCDLYENDSIFDKFQCCVSNDGSNIATGSYGNVFKSFNTATDDNGASGATFEVSKDPSGKSRGAASAVKTPQRNRMDYTTSTGSSNTITANDVFSLSPADFAAGKILHMAWHPSENIVATAAANSLYFYNAA
mmetsp:Transcript_7639/g.17169  ORF Transcript_7639/g.17169 Transcript_7639/m.17169 type:complete len:517 (-) Transcript_7639:45-1595(-)